MQLCCVVLCIVVKGYMFIGVGGDGRRGGTVVVDLMLVLVIVLWVMGGEVDGI